MLKKKSGITEKRIKQIAAYLFFIWDQETDVDPNRQLTSEEVAEYHEIAERFYVGAVDILVNLDYIESTEYEIQSFLYDAGKRSFGNDKKQLNLWFKCLYTIFFGRSVGSRIGTFIYIYGQEEFSNRLYEKINAPFV